MNTGHKQFIVYQEHRHADAPRKATHSILAGPFASEEEASTSARAHWKREARTFLREISDTLGLVPEPVRCQCHAQVPDLHCLLGPYLVERATALQALTEHVGFGYLPPCVKALIEKQYERWRGKYLQHLLHEERQHQA